MAQTITRPFVERQLENLNRLTGMPSQPYLNLNDGKGIVPQAGNYHLDNAYGGYCFRRMSLTPGSSGDSAVVDSGYVPLKVVSAQIQAYARGYQDAKDAGQLRLQEQQAKIRSATTAIQRLLKDGCLDPRLLCVLQANQVLAAISQ
jgi:hypothetical protein